MEKVKDLPNMLNLFVECLEISWGPWTCCSWYSCTLVS
jgi:hypothetical protein